MESSEQPPVAVEEELNRVELIEMVEDRYMEREKDQWMDIDVVGLRKMYGKRNSPHVAYICMDEAKQDVLNVFLDRMEAGELSERVYDLTSEIILQINSAEYSTWEWRWRCLSHLMEKRGHREMVHLEKELMRSVATSNPKNYQLWNYRRKLAVLVGPSCLDDEMVFTDGCLQVDGKNYHAWAHRQALIREFWSDVVLRREQKFVVDCLGKDCYNNSAWTQKAFLLDMMEARGCKSCPEMYMDEMQSTMSHLEHVVDNESAWAFLKHIGLYRAPSQEHLEEYLRFCAKMIKIHPNSIEVGTAFLDYYKCVILQLKDTGAIDDIQSCERKIQSIQSKLCLMMH